ncbi:zinc-binding dehydrogenase [Klenkia terrae]
MCGISTFSEYTTADVASVIKIDKDIPLKSAALVGCGVPTGFGTAVKAGGVKPGDVVIVMGIGGIGINAVQGAAHAGATNVIAVDPIPFKREMAQEFGATDVFENMEQATEFAQSITEGQGADVALITVGVLKPEHPAQGLASIRKGGTVVVTGLGNMAETTPISAFDLTLLQKRLQGAIIGAQSPHSDIPKLLRMYQAGQLKLDELITKEYTLDQVTEAYRDMHEGKNIRGVIVFD